MANARACGKSRKVSGPHRVEIAVDPRVHLTLENVHKLFLFLLGVRPRASHTRRQSHQVHADLYEAGSFADAPFIAHVFVAVRIMMPRLRTRLGSNDEWWPLVTHPVPVTSRHTEC